MKKIFVYISWAVAYLLSVIFGLFITPGNVGKLLLAIFSVLFFLPPFYLTALARKEKNRKALMSLRLISICVLVISLILLVLNFLSVYFSANAGLVLYILLVVFSAPMVCGQYWVLSLFLWACLLMFSLLRLNPEENAPVQK